jgi:glutamyl-tRNA synthetase
MMNNHAPIRGRLAPSPTGAQHVGNARTYLIAWLSARSRNAELLLRIEDIDSPRVKAGATELILEDLRWLGLDWDGEPVVQTNRLPLYEAALQKLRGQELVYPCTCSRSDVAEAASAPHGDHAAPMYPGTCAHRRSADAEMLGDRPYAWRFRMAEVGVPALAGAGSDVGRLKPELQRVLSSDSEFVDVFLGPTRVDPNELGDFVVWKSAGTPAYQLAVVVDDADMGITEVVRGDDLVPSTPRQLLLYQALQWRPPQFVHVPLVVGPDGRRLAKRHGDTRLAALREAGVRPADLIGLLAWSCGWLPKPEPVAARDLLPLYRLAAIPRQPFVLTPALLRSIGYTP